MANDSANVERTRQGRPGAKGINVNIPLQDLNGPQRANAESIIREAFKLDLRHAQALEQAWDAPNSQNENQLTYLIQCKAVWDALEESGRFLPLGWFEAIFADCEWVDTTRALHSVADAVCAILVRDLISESTFQYMTVPWVTVMSISVK